MDDPHWRSNRNKIMENVVLLAPCFSAMFLLKALDWYYFLFLQLCGKIRRFWSVFYGGHVDLIPSINNATSYMKRGRIVSRNTSHNLMWISVLSQTSVHILVIRRSTVQILEKNKQVLSEIIRWIQNFWIWIKDIIS